MLYEIVSLLDAILGPSRQFANNEYYYSCPMCHHYKPKLAVNLNKRKWQCWKCGARGSTLLSLVRKLHVTGDQIRKLQILLQDELPRVKDETDIVVFRLPDEYIALADETSTAGARQALAYLRGREVTNAEILRYRIGFCEEGEYRGRVIIPSYDADGNLNFFVGRSFWQNTTSPHMNPRISKNIIGFANQINWKYPIVLVEGVFDAMAVKRNAIPLFGKTPSKKLQEKIISEGVKDVYLALDNDALKESLNMAEKFMRNNINVYLIRMEGKDPSALGFTETQYLIQTAEKMTFASLISLKLTLK